MSDWPEAVSDGLTLPCSDCDKVPRFDYRVTEGFWAQHVPDKPARLGVICLPCLDRRCKGAGLAVVSQFEIQRLLRWLVIGVGLWLISGYSVIAKGADLNPHIIPVLLIGDYLEPKERRPEFGSLVVALVSIVLAFGGICRGLIRWREQGAWLIGWIYLIGGSLCLLQGTIGFLLGLDIWSLLDARW